TETIKAAPPVRRTPVYQGPRAPTDPHNPLFVAGMWGLGDNILQRPFIRALTRRRQIYLETPWPELYRGINNLIFVEGRRELRTQLKNIARQNGSVWRPAPPGLDR